MSRQSFKVNADQYFEVCGERIQQAQRLYDSGKSFALAMYCGGLAVESLFRAFRCLDNPEFDSRHDLKLLLEDSHFLEFYDAVPPGHDKKVSFGKIQTAIQELTTLWLNTLRYSSESRLRSHLVKIGRVRGIKGDPLKPNAKSLLDAAQTIIDQGVLIWTLKKKL